MAQHWVNKSSWGSFFFYFSCELLRLILYFLLDGWSLKSEKWWQVCSLVCNSKLKWLCLWLNKCMNAGQDKNCTMEDLQTMFMEMAEDFDIPSWPCEPSAFEDASIIAMASSWPCEPLVYKDASLATPSSRTHWDSKRRNLPFHVSGFAMSSY